MTIELSDDDEVLFRQVHPGFMQGDAPSSQSFMPTPKDDNKLSVDRSALTTAKDSYRLFTGNGFESTAVYGLTVGEFRGQDIPCIEDPLEASDGKAANPAHALADYEAHPPSRQKTKAKRLKQKALARGRLYP